MTCFALAQNTALELIEMNVIYAGLDNPTRIASSIRSEKLVISTSPNIKYNEGVITTNTLDDGIGYVYIGELKRRDTTWKDTITLRIRSLPKPRAQLGGLRNDGLPKGRASILAQSIVLATMGAGFAIPQFRVRVVSFELIVVYKEKLPYLERGHSKTLTSTMRGALQAAQDGDYFIIQDITAKEMRYDLTYNLDPIIITLRGNSQSKFDGYVKISGQKGKETVTTNNLLECATLLDSMEEGTVEIYRTTEEGFIRKQYVYQDSQVIKKSIYDDEGVIQTTKNLLPDNVWEYKVFFPNGKPRIHTFYRDGDVLLANDSFAICWDQARQDLSWSDDSNLIKPKDCYGDKIAGDLYEVYALSRIAPYHHFTSFYENGNVKCEGDLIRKEGRELKNMSWCGTGITYYDYNNHTLMDGEWLFYNEDGTLIKKINYDTGTEIK